MNQNLKNSAQALLAMQRMSWEQGVAAQAFFEYGRPDIGMLMVREALRRSDGKGLLGITNPAMDSVDCGANGLPLYYAYQYTGGPRFIGRPLQRLADWLEFFRPPGRSSANCIITRQPENDDRRNLSHSSAFSGGRKGRVRGSAGGAVSPEAL